MKELFFAVTLTKQETGIMPLTMDLLEYQLSFGLSVEGNRPFDRQELRTVRFLREGEAPRRDTLYLTGPEQLAAPPFRIDGCHFLCTAPTGAEGCDVLASAVFQEPTALFNAVQETFWDYAQWRQTTQEALKTAGNLNRILESAAAYLRTRLALVASDYTVLGQAGSGPDIGGMVENGRKMSLNSVSALEQEAEYRHVLEHKGVFEYPSLKSGLRVLCFNIFIEGSYFARLLTTLPRERPWKGAGQVMEELGVMLTAYYTENRYPHRKKENREELERVLRQLLTGEIPERRVVERGIACRDWLPGDRYEVVKLEFMLDVSLKYYCVQVQELFPGCVCVILDGAIYGVRNMSRSPYEREEEQRFPVFLRDSLCKAGRSVTAKNIFQLPSRRREADFALRLGRERRKTLWYFQFSDFAMDFVAEVALEKQPMESLLHPAVIALRDYDRVKNAELTDTLRQFLLCYGSSTQAAQALFIHRTTLIHRLERIRKLTGVSLDDPKERLHLEFSFFLLERGDEL